MANEEIKEIEIRKINLRSFFSFEASEIEASSRIADAIHKTGNFVSTGNEVEITVREFLKNKLENKFYVSNGHILDSEMSVSSQLDIIISDNNKSPILYKTIDKTDYLAYESVYAIGEVKKNWYTEYFEKFKYNISKIKSELKRDQVTKDYLDIGGKGIKIDMDTTTFPYKNPLFYFGFIVTSDRLTNPSMDKFFTQDADWSLLPNMICFLTRGLILNVRKNTEKLIVNLYPEFIKQEDKKDNQWVLVNFDKSSDCLGCFYYLLREHLFLTTLYPPNMLNYMQKIFKINKEDIREMK